MGALAWLLLFAAPARAHQSSIAWSDIALDGSNVDYTIQIADTDLFEAVGVERDRPVTRDEVRAGQERLFAYLGARLHVDERGAPCPVEPRGLDLVDKLDGFFVAAHLRFRCPRPIEAARLTYDLFFDLDPRHQGIAHLRERADSDEGREQVLREGQRTFELRRTPTRWEHAGQFLRLGVEHILTGYDHLAFLLALLIVAGGAGLRSGGRRVLGVVTAFTIAHSITLVTAALSRDVRAPLYVLPAVAAALAGQILVEDRRFPAARARQRAPRLALYAGLGLLLATVALRLAPGLALDPGRLVEASIALSIVYVAVENLVVPEPAHRFLVTFGFGLIHGFGFASVLREIGLPEQGLLLSLVSFNVGVEVGQLAVVLAVLPLLALWAQRRGYEAVVRRGGSAVVAALAMLWLLERVTGRVVLGGALG